MEVGASDRGGLRLQVKLTPEEFINKMGQSFTTPALLNETVLFIDGWFMVIRLVIRNSLLFTWGRYFVGYRGFYALKKGWHRYHWLFFHRRG